MSRTSRNLALASILLLCAPVAAQALPAPAEADPLAGIDKPLLRQDRAYYGNDIAPRREEPAEDARVKTSAADRKATAKQGQAEVNTGFPPAAKQLARREALASTRNISPRTSARRAGQKAVQTAQLLTLLVQFSANANDNFSGFRRYDQESGGCVTEPGGTLLNGPLRNELPDPANTGEGTDNYTFWVPDFTPGFYRDLIYSTAGVRQRIRPDLNGGVNIAGKTVKNYYLENSKGRYVLDGDVSPWLTLPHSEAYYSADTCAAGRASDVGHPTNPLGTGQMAIDAIKALGTADPSFPWSDYDIEDQGDRDRDGNLYEPDGALDHVIVLHAGADQADDGGAQGSYAEWSSANVVGAATGGVPLAEADGLRVFNFTTQPEDAGVGVIAHEYGHDLGLPDLYDSVGQGTDSDVGWWDLMSTGAFGGELSQTEPAHMGAWSKYVLGWITPEVLEYGSRTTTARLGQASRPPAGTEEAVRVNLPAKEVAVGSPHGGDLAWWTSNDQSWADVRLTRAIDVPTGADVRFWSWNEYLIEELWDYGFIEVSTNGGGTWTQLEVRDDAGNLVSTDEDPNGNLEAYGGLENGLTGSSDGYRHDWVNLTPYAGSTIQLRLRYATDAAFEERGWFADDFSVTVNGTQVWTDDVEAGANGWTAQRGTFTDTSGAGWVRTSGTLEFEQYYLLEWRNFDGYDNGLKTAFTTNYFVNGEWNVGRTPYNAPGMLIWHRDASHSLNDVGNNLFDPPSIGSKGTLLLVDAHYEPERWTGEAAAANPSQLDNLRSRQQASDVAFGRVGRYGFTDCVPSSVTDPYEVVCQRFGSRPAVRSFTDASTWYPGIEYRPDLDDEEPLFFRDSDASTVVPSKNNTVYSTRVVDRDGRPVPSLYGLELPGGQVLGSGNPRDGRPAVEDGDPGTTADLSLGVTVRLVAALRQNTAALVLIKPGQRSSDSTTARSGQR